MKWIIDVATWDGRQITHVERRSCLANEEAMARKYLVDGGYAVDECWTEEDYVEEHGDLDGIDVLHCG